MAAERRIELWPLLLVGLLLAGIGTSLAFYAVARSHPDPEVAEEARRVGRAVEMRAPSGPLGPRLG